MKASVVVMVVLSIFVLAGATTEPIEPLVVFGDAMGWIRAVQGSAAAQQTIGGRALQATPSIDSCSPSEKQVVKACLSTATAGIDETLLEKNKCDALKVMNRIIGCMLQASCINFATPELQAEAKKDGLCALSDRNSKIASDMAEFKSECPGVDMENIKLFTIKWLDAVCGGSTNIVAIVGISAAVVLVLAVAFCVYKNKKDARAASSESKAGRTVAVGNMI